MNGFSYRDSTIIPEHAIRFSNNAVKLVNSQIPVWAKHFFYVPHGMPEKDLVYVACRALAENGMLAIIDKLHFAVGEDGQKRVLTIAQRRKIGDFDLAELKRPGRKPGPAKRTDSKPTE